MDYIKKLEELTEAIHKIEDIIKEMNAEKQAIDHVTVSTPPDTVLYPDHRTDTECEIVCFANIGSQAFDLRDLIDTKVSGEFPVAYGNINGVEVSQWTLDAAREKKND